MKILACAACLFLLGQAQQSPQPAAPRATVIRAGRLIDPATGTSAANQTIVVENGRIAAVGANVALPAGAEIIDLSRLTVLPGLVDAHNHLALTYKQDPESNVYYLTYVLDSTALRAIQAVSNGMQMLSAGFTVVRDLGNNGNYADTALRVAIEQGWVPGPTIVNSGIIIGGMGGQFSPTPEMAKDHNIVYPEYLDADTHDEIVKAVRQNILFGAKVIKVCVDCKPYPYTVEDLKTFVAEAANAGLKVAGHVQTKVGALRAIEAGFWSLEHSGPLDTEVHKLMAQKGIWRVGTETPFTPYRGTQAAFDDVLKIMTTNGYEVSDIAARRGPIKVGFPADMIAVAGNPLEDLETLRTVPFVMKDGLVFKRDGVMTPEAFLHGGPVNGWRIR